MSEPRARAVLASRRRLIEGAAGTLVLALAPWQIARGAALLGVRVWPAPAYTRVTLEHDAPLKFTQFMVRDTPPLRLVVEIEGIDLSPGLSELVGKIEADDPYIARVRLGQNRPRVVRLVVELKADVAPEVFLLAPAGPYQHRLVLDLYPLDAPDPLAELLRAAEARSAAPLPQPTLPTPPPAQDDAAFERELERALAWRDAPRRPAPKANDDVRRFVTVALDPGHGGEDPGAVGRGGTFEKTVTLSIAKRLARLLEAEPNTRVLLTRDGDYFVPLGTRVAKARRVKADLFVSVHADAWIRPDARGSSVFALSERGASSSAAAMMAKRENDADLIGGVNLASHDPGLARLLLDLSTTAQINDSLVFGNAVLREIERVNDLHKPRVEQASFAVLKAPDIPSILIETAFISNPDEERRLRDDGYQQGVAQAIFNGIQRYLRKNPPRARSPLS
jgi:N-acetylmuramoyl-L-alanine amidase